MLDRMFLNDEQQSLMKLRQDYENELLNIPLAEPELPPPPLPPPPHTHTMTSNSNNMNPNSNNANAIPTEQEDYDEWACIQRELAGLPQQNDSKLAQSKRSASSDSRLETLKRFRVDKHHKRPTDVIISSGSSVQSVVSSTVYAHAQSKVVVSAGSSACAYENAQNSSFSSHEDNEPENNSIDEQVQSAIDSILNLQQNPSLDLDSILSWRHI